MAWTKNYIPFRLFQSSFFGALSKIRPMGLFVASPALALDAYKVLYKRRREGVLKSGQKQEFSAQMFLYNR